MLTGCAHFSLARDPACAQIRRMESPVAPGVQMREIEVNGIKLDVCPVSGGIWFDNYELEKFDEEHEPLGEEIESIRPQPGYRRNPLLKLKSPRRPDVTMLTRVYSYKGQVEIDECPATGGIWLDFGELQKIRELYPDADERERMADEVVARLLESDPEVQREKAELQELQQRAQRVSNLFRFFGRKRQKRH